MGQAGTAGWRGSRHKGRLSLARSLWQTTHVCAWAWMAAYAWLMVARLRLPIRWPGSGRLPRAGCPCFWNGLSGEMEFLTRKIRDETDEHGKNKMIWMNME